MADAAALRTTDSERKTPFDELDRFEAVQLFCERARSARRSFELAEDNAVAIVQICQALDGLPLAIELAAARTRALSPQQIAERLDDRFGLLTSRSATALPRHRALRTTLAWSYDLLDEREQVLLRRLAIFPSDFSLPAVEAVCGSGSLAGADLLDLLTQLIDKSLVVMRDQHGMALPVAQHGPGVRARATRRGRRALRPSAQARRVLRSVRRSS